MLLNYFFFQVKNKMSDTIKRFIEEQYTVGKQSLPKKVSNHCTVALAQPYYVKLFTEQLNMAFITQLKTYWAERNPYLRMSISPLFQEVFRLLWQTPLTSSKSACRAGRPPSSRQGDPALNLP